MLSLGLSTAVRCGRTECVPPRRPPSASSPGLPRKAISPPPRPPRRGGLRTPAMTPLASPRHVPARPPARRLALGGHHDMPRLAYGRYSRARRPRPSEETTSAPSPGLPRKAIPPWTAHPAEGRAPHARNDGIGLAGACRHLATRYSFASDDHVMPRLASGLATRTHGVRPSEKTGPGVIPGFSPQGHLALDGSPLGGAGSARPQGRHDANPSAPPFGHRPFRPPTRNHDMPRLASGRYSLARRPRPSEETTPRAVSGPSSARPSHPRMVLPRRGGLRTPTRKASRQKQHCHLLATGPSPSFRRSCRAPARIRPHHADARSASLRENRPRRYPGFSPEGDPRCAWPPRGKAGSARPQGRHDANPSAPPFGHRPFRPPTRNHDMPRLASGLTTRTHGVRPSEKTGPGVIPGFSPQGHLRIPGWLSPEGRAPHARKVGSGLTEASPR
jgi:hypothetical protein